MSRRIDIELTSALADNSWTWRAAGAKKPKGVLDGSILSDGASVGDVIKVEVDQEIDGITVLSVVGGRQKEERDLLELLPSEREFKPVIETKAKRDRNDRGDRGGRDGDRRPRRDDRGGRGRDGGRDGGKGRDGGGRDDKGGRGRDGGDRQGRGGRDGRRGPSFTPPPEIPQRPKPKRLKAGKGNRNAVLAELPEEQRSIAELALQGMGAVRSRLKEANQKAVTEGRAPMPEASVLKMAEDILPKMRVAEWLDRAEAAKRQMEHLDLRDLRSVVAAAGDPMIARDDATSALAAELTSALATKQEQELLLWFGDVDAALAVGRVIRALRLSSQPPKAGMPFPSDIAQRLADSTNAALAPNDSPERWSATLEAAAFSPVRAQVLPARKPDTVNDDLLKTVKRLAPALPQVAALFDVEVDPNSSMPKPLRPGPRNKKGDNADRGKRPGRDKQSAGGKGSTDSQRPPRADKRAPVIPPPPQTEPSSEAPASTPDGAPSVVEDAPQAPGAEAAADENTAQSAPAAEPATAQPAASDDAPAAEADAPEIDATPTPAPAAEPATAQPVTSDDAPAAEADAPEIDATPTPAPAAEPATAQPAASDDAPAASSEPTAPSAGTVDAADSTESAEAPTGESADDPELS